MCSPNVLVISVLLVICCYLSTDHCDLHLWIFLKVIICLVNQEVLGNLTVVRKCQEMTKSRGSAGKYRRNVGVARVAGDADHTHGDIKFCLANFLGRELKFA